MGIVIALLRSLLTTALPPLVCRRVSPCLAVLPAGDGLLAPPGREALAPGVHGLDGQPAPRGRAAHADRHERRTVPGTRRAAVRALLDWPGDSGRQPVG